MDWFSLRFREEGFQSKGSLWLRGRKFTVYMWMRKMSKLLIWFRLLEMIRQLIRGIHVLSVLFFCYGKLKKN